MTTVWLVSSGSYSDYRIRAVFSTEAKAQAYADWQNGPDPDACCRDRCKLEPFDLDEPPILPTGRFVAQFFDHLDGLGSSETSVCWDPDCATTEAATATNRPRWVGYRAAAETAEHARRSVDELRRAVKAGTYILPPETQ